MRELPARLRQSHRGHIGGGRIDIHVTLLELPRVDIHPADPRNDVGTQGLAQVNVVVLVIPNDLVVAAVSPVETEVRVAQDVVLAEEEGSQRVPKGLPKAHGVAVVVRPGLARRELRVAEHRGLCVREGGHRVDLELPFRLLEELDRPGPPHHGKGAFLKEHVRRIGVGIQSQPRGAPGGQPRPALVAPQLLAVAMQPRCDRADERIHADGPCGSRGILCGDRVVPELTCGRHAVVGVDAVGDPGLIDEIGLDRRQPVRLIGGGAEVHEVVEVIGGGVRVDDAVDAVSPGIKQE